MIFRGKKMAVKWIVENEENGQLGKFYCTICKQDLSRVFYTWGGAYQFLGVYDCKHYEWVFVGDYDLDPPWDEETKKIVENSLGSVVEQHGKYFLLPRSFVDRYK